MILKVFNEIRLFFVECFIVIVTVFQWLTVFLWGFFVTVLKRVRENKGSVIASFLLGFLVTVLVFWGVFIFGLLGVPDITKTAQLGDSFGWLTSVFAGISVVLIYLTLKSQKEELAITRTQIKYQQIENSLFQMFGILNEIVAAISLTKNVYINHAQVTKTYKDRESFHHAYEKFYSLLKIELKKNMIMTPDKEDEFGGSITSEDKIPCENLVGENNYIFGQVYDELWPELRPQFGHYFRYLYRIIKVIDDSELPNQQKIKLAKVVRAQLSDYELAILFYNIQSSVGDKFESLCYRYDLLDNLPKDLYLCPHHRQIMFNLRDRYLLRDEND